MNTKETTQEQISALADGELDKQQTASVLAALRREDNSADWEIYHQIGDVLRSDDMDVKLSSGFAARMAARLEMEPTYIAPAALNEASMQAAPQPAIESGSFETRAARRNVKRWAMPGIAAAAAMATVAFVMSPQLMVANSESTSAAPVTLASTAPVASPTTQDVMMSGPQTAVISADAPEGVVLRDPRIDDYLLAHQRFSPSVYSTAQYARSATFANDSNK